MGTAMCWRLEGVIVQMHWREETHILGSALPSACYGLGAGHLITSPCPRSFPSRAGAELGTFGSAAGSETAHWRRPRSMGNSRGTDMALFS